MALLTFLSLCIVSAPSSVRHASGFHGSFHLRQINIYKLTTVGKEIYKLVSADKEKRNSFYKTLACFFHEKGKVHISKHKIVKLNNNDSQVICKQNGEDI